MNGCGIEAGEYDYVIVGAGSAGCVLANRLSENPRNRVLLVEAGGTDKKFWIKMPLGYAFTFSDPKVNWRYIAEADQGLNGREIYWPRGKVIGGSSSINAMAYLRGLPHDFDDWARAGAEGWTWQLAEKTYNQLEKNSELNEKGERSVRGDGPVWVWDNSDRMHPFSKHFLAAAKEMQWPVLDDLNREACEGLAYVRSTVFKGRRWSSADAFLRPALKRQNLRVIKNARVEKVDIIDAVARGISYRVGEQRYSAKALKEVIVSAGAINSPQLLQLSGVGPAALLKRHGIDVKHHLPEVGKGLQDHLAVSHYFRSNRPTLNNKLGNLFGKVMSGADYILRRKGPLSVPINQVTGFVRSDRSVAVPDIQLYCNPGSYITTSSGETLLDCEPGFLLCAQPSRPTSRGTINISSANPEEAPDIQPNSLSTEEDRQVVIKAGHLLQKLAQIPAIKNVTEAALVPDITGMNEEEILQNFQERASTVFHPASTCRMGTSAENSVLNSRLQVHGIKKLRVVDASAFPNITSGNINAPTLMLAARAADIILQDDLHAREKHAATKN
ncbi:MAG: GMC family oxidoreductase N-terminal domain-containing protein [Sneathiella sp.]